MDFEKFKSVLNEQMTWPDYYSFKFVIKVEQKESLINLLDGHKISERPSKNGNFISVTGRKLVNTADEVVEVYQKASTIKGILSL